MFKAIQYPGYGIYEGHLGLKCECKAGPPSGISGPDARFLIRAPFISKKAKKWRKVKVFSFISKKVILILYIYIYIYIYIYVYI